MQNSKSKYKSNLIHRCYRFSLEIIKLTDIAQNKISTNIITRQLIRSATSVGANLVEGSASSSKRDFKHYHEISLKSANETQYWLMLLKESGLNKSPLLPKLLSESTELARMLGSSILTMKGKRKI